jgi:hypothetical protein
MATKPEAVVEPVASFERAREEQCRAEFSMWKDRPYFSIRCWFKNDKQEMQPGKNGINLPVEEKKDFLKLVAALFPDDVRLIETEG